MRNKANPPQEDGPAYYWDDLEVENPKSERSSTRLLLIVSALAAALFFGGTYAANININSGTATEFGQGVLSTVVCGGDPITVKVTPVLAFKNSSGSGNYEISQIKVGDIPTRCNGNVFTLKAWGETGSELPLYRKKNSISEKYYSVDVLASGGVYSLVTGLDSAIDPNDISYTTNEFTVNLYNSTGTPIEAATSSSNVYRITMESSNKAIDTVRLAMFGGVGGGANNVLCNSNEVSTGFNIETTTFISSGFTLLCTNVIAGPALGGTTRSITAVNNATQTSKACPAGKVMIGTVVASGQYIKDMAPVCADFPSKLNPVTGNMFGQATNGSSTCPKDTWGVGFSGSFGSGVDRMALVCRKLA
jgi:hypothetical protein